MNLILFEKAETRITLAPDDPRAAHVRRVLKTKPGESFDVGAVNGPRGKARVQALEPEMELEFTWTDEPEPLHPVHLIAGLPRPQTARKILCAAAEIGLSAVSFFQSEKGEPSYAGSKLWSTGEWRRHLIQGAEQAFATNIPEVRHYPGLKAALAQVESGARLALDVYEATAPLSRVALGALPVHLATGPERGWSAGERQCLRGRGFTLASLGRRVLRSETACACAAAVILARLGKL